MILLLLLSSLLSACAIGGPAVGTGGTPPKNGPIQLYDLHGKLICQIHGQNLQLDCLNNRALQSPLAFQFIDYAINELASDLRVNPTHLPSSQLNVSTTLDLDLQSQVLQKAQQYIATMANTHHMTNAAVVIIDYHTGSIRSLIGSLDGPTATNRLNVVTQKLRQVGSVFKPLVYATAFDQGISPGEVVYDGPFSVGTPPYSPFNYDRRFHGYMSYRSALQNDFNIPALKLFVKTGFDSLKQKAVALGINPDEFGATGYYAMPLGPMEMPLLDATVAYGTMANSGLHIPPHAIDKISTSDGHIVYTTQSQPMRALNAGTAFMMTDVMSDNTARKYEYGQCSPMLLYTTSQAQCQAGNPGPVRPAAVHSSVNDAFKDTLSIGYTTDFVVGAWTGNDDDSQMFNITALNGAAQIWHDSMQLVEGNAPIKPFPGPPPGVVKQTVHYPNLTTTDWYLTK